MLGKNGVLFYSNFPINSIYYTLYASTQLLTTSFAGIIQNMGTHTHEKRTDFAFLSELQVTFVMGYYNL